MGMAPDRARKVVAELFGEASERRALAERATSPGGRQYLIDRALDLERRAYRIANDAGVEPYPL